nr:MAG TPA: Peptidoglycan endopeptidase [Caudoviricetes sp.]
MKRNVKLTRLLKLALLLLAFCLSTMTCTGVGTAEAAEPTYIKIQLEQWKEFKQNTNLLQAKLSLLESALTTQKGTSSELLTQLAEAKMQLQEAQQALTTSNRSLASAKESLKRSNDLYETLMNQIEHDRRVYLRVKRQRNLYAGCAVFVLAYAVAK